MRPRRGPLRRPAAKGEMKKPLAFFSSPPQHPNRPSMFGLTRKQSPCRRRRLARAKPCRRSPSSRRRTACRSRSSSACARRTRSCASSSRRRSSSSRRSTPCCASSRRRWPTRRARRPRRALERRRARRRARGPLSLRALSRMLLLLSTLSVPTALASEHCSVIKDADINPHTAGIGHIYGASIEQCCATLRVVGKTSTDRL